jgi:transposase
VIRTQLDEATRKRIRAGRLLQRGKRPAEIAATVGVVRQTVYRWKAVLENEGFEALRALGGPGPKAQMTPADLAALRRIVMQSPTQHGFGTELWTLKRVGALIERLYGVRFGQTNVWRILGSLGFSPQKPEKRAIERNEDAVRSWKRSTWPALKKKPSEKVAKLSS